MITYNHDTSVPVEFFIETIGDTYASGYLLAGSQVLLPDTEERMMIIVTTTIYDDLKELIEEYRSTLSQELIYTELLVVQEDDTVEQIKSEIKNRYQNAPLDYILLLGHVPVPYSGNSALDGHQPDHEGAWVCDGFYGDIDGRWTDNVINNTGANRDANDNIPGDGKYDQNYFPSDIEIAVGRIDFSDLPKLKESETELTRRYLRRNIDYRLGKYKAPRRAIIDNNFNHAEGFGQGAIKAFHTFLEPDSISYGRYDQCLTQEYLFTFGAGAGGYQNASGVIKTDQLVNDSIQSVFTTIFGSYFGDWDVSNNLLRATLARGNALINAWSGRPIWYFHHMAMGKPVGHVLLNTQNANGGYYTQFGSRRTPTSLLGDPSIKMYYHEPVENISLENDRISWTYNNQDKEVTGYTVYYRQKDEWKFLGMRTDTDVDLSAFPEGGYTEVMVKPVALISSPSGSYYNEGNGRMIEFTTSSTEEIITGLSIYPNPANNQLVIKDVEAQEVIRIYDMTGRQLIQSLGKSVIDISELSPGTYLLRKKNSTLKFIKQ